MKKFKTATLVALIVTLVISCFAMAGCGKNTLEDYAKDHGDFQTSIQKKLNLNNMSGKVEIKDNEIRLTTDVKRLISGVKLTKQFKKSLKSSFDSTFDYLAGNFAKNIKSIEKQTDCDDVTLTIVINVGKEKLGEYKFTDESKSKNTDTKSDKKDSKDKDKDNKKSESNN